MERVAFLIEQTQERLACLLNPESLVLRRTAGIRSRASSGGQLTGAGLADDPLLYTGGGRTEIELHLLFDVQLAGSTVTTDDVRNLTAPFWNLAENRDRAGGFGELPLVRFIWGKHWNIAGVIVAVSERMEDFTAAGAPQRSWLRLKMLRVQENGRVEPPTPQPETAPTLEDLDTELAESELRFHEVVAGDRLDAIASAYYGDASYWRLLATFNGLSDPFDLPPGLLLTVPPAPDVVWWALSNYDEIAATVTETFSSLLRLRPAVAVRVAL